jgi:hypothetical protein
MGETVLEWGTWRPTGNSGEETEAVSAQLRAVMGTGSPQLTYSGKEETWAGADIGGATF